MLIYIIVAVVAYFTGMIHLGATEEDPKKDGCHILVMVASMLWPLTLVFLTFFGLVEVPLWIGSKIRKAYKQK